MELGLVDLNESLDSQVAAMIDACEGPGFFRIPRSVVPADVADAAWSAATDFFALPDSAKREVGFPEPGYPYGYSPLRFETLSRSRDDDEDAVGDLKESFSVGPDCADGRPGGPEEAWVRSPSLWPRAVPGLRPAWTAYYRALDRVAARLMSVMAVALGLAPDHFEPLIDRPITSMRAIHYPAVDPAEPGLRAGAHSDYGTLTILRTDAVAGLQILDPTDGWIDVAPDPEMFIVNLGDSIAQWTNDRWRSTVHRVVPDRRPRQSMAFFHMANWDATIECLPGCAAPGEQPRHAPVMAGPWLMKKFQSTVMATDGNGGE